MNIKIRDANISDANLIYEWTNDPLTRKNSFNSKQIEWEDHIKWLEMKIKDEKYFIYIFEAENKPIGMVRFESNEYAVIGVTIAPDFRGKGFGSEIIKLGCERFSLTNKQKILAYIKTANSSSIKVFQKAGFSFIRDNEYNSIPCKILILRRNANS